MVGLVARGESERAAGDVLAEQDVAAKGEAAELTDEGLASGLSELAKVTHAVGASGLTSTLKWMTKSQDFLNWAPQSMSGHVNAGAPPPAIWSSISMWR